MKSELPSQTNTNISGCPLVPKSIVTASRCELTDTQMVIDGSLPEDLHGHVFMVAPAGTVDSGGLPFPDGDSILNGDGMIYRLDFDRKGEVRLKTRLAKPPDYYADKATRGTKYAKYQFRDHGITRFSFVLGSRNELNTALLPMKFSDESNERLLVTYDAGRPYEIDPETLEVVTPVGSNVEWRAELDGLNFPFQPFLSTAHPAFDAHTNTMFTVNYGRSIDNFLETIPFIYDLEQLPQAANGVLLAIADSFQGALLRDSFNIFSEFFQNVFRLYMSLIERIVKVEIKDFVYLIRWDGLNHLERWKLVLADRSPVRIEQSMHQIGVTKDYVVLLDTAFTTGLEQALNNPFPENKVLEKVLRNQLESPATPDSIFYIVRREDLKAGQYPACGQQEVEVVVQQVKIPLPAAHFLVDYENPNGNITLHVAHICSMQVAEWIRQYDISAYKPNDPVPSYLYGMESNETDIGRLGRYVIDQDGDLIESQVISDFECTWGIELFAYLDRLPTGLPPQRQENIYWCSFGLWKQLMTQYVVDLYKDYKYRQVPISKVLSLADKGIPAYLFRLHTESMEIADRYEFPLGYMTLSPQFIPRGDGESSTNGYIVCTVWYGENNEFWIFDANNLAKGPLCKLHHPSLSFGLTLHTAWLSRLARREAKYNIPVRQDYQDLVKPNLELEELFEQEVYPHFE